MAISDGWKKLVKHFKGDTTEPHNGEGGGTNTPPTGGVATQRGQAQQEYTLEELKNNGKFENRICKLKNGELFNGIIRRINSKGEVIISEFKNGKLTKLTRDFTQDNTNIAKMVTEYSENGEKQIKYLNNEGKEVSFFEELAKTDGEHILRNGTRIKIENGQVRKMFDKDGNQVYNIFEQKEGGYNEHIYNIKDNIDVKSIISENLNSHIALIDLAAKPYDTGKSVVDLRQELVDKYIKDSSIKKAILERIPKDFKHKDILFNDVNISTHNDGRMTITAHQIGGIRTTKNVYSIDGMGTESVAHPNEHNKYFYHRIENGMDVYFGPDGLITKEEFIKQRNHAIATALTDEQIASIGFKTTTGEIVTRTNSLPTNIDGNYILKVHNGGNKCDYAITNSQGKIVGKINNYSKDGHFDYIEIYNEHGEKIRRIGRIDENEYGETLFDHGKKEGSAMMSFGDSHIVDTLKALIEDTKGLLL